MTTLRAYEFLRLGPNLTYDSNRPSDATGGKSLYRKLRRVPANLMLTVKLRELINNRSGLKSKSINIRNCTYTSQRLDTFSGSYQIETKQIIMII